MRKITLFALTIFCTLHSAFSAGFYQLQNSDFEQWETVNGGEEPVMWNTYASAGGSLGGTVKSIDQGEQSKDIRPGSTGSYSAKIKARSVLGVATANGMLTTGQIEGNSMSPSSPDNHNITNRSTGFASPMTGRPDSVAAWLKTAPKNKSQLCRYYFLLHGDYNTQDPGTDMSQVVAIAGTNVAYNADWQRVCIPFYYKGEPMSILNEKGVETRTPACNDERPSYCLASIATNYLPGKGDKTDALYVDDLVMIYNSKLSSLNINGKALAGFSKDIYTYNVDEIYEAGIVTCKSDGRFATVEQSYNEATNTLTITVKGDDYEANKKSLHTYELKFKTIQACDAALTDFSYNGKKIDGFKSSTKKYTLSDTYSASAVKYTVSDCATATESWDPSTLTLSIKVTSKSGYSADENIYEFQFHAPYESLITSIKINGSPLSGFSSSNHTYSIAKVYEEGKTTIEYTISEGAEATEKYDSETNSYIIVVKGGDYASNKENTNTYTIAFHDAYGSQLNAIKVNRVTIDGFSPNKYSYTVDQYYNDITISYDVDDEASTSESYNDKTNTLTIVVSGGDIAENSSNKHTYTVQFMAPFTLTSLMTDNKLVPNFRESKYSYSLTSLVYENVDVTYTFTGDATATTSFDEESALYTLTLTGNDIKQFPTNKKVYTIQFHTSYSSFLAELMLNGTPLDGFSKKQFDYLIPATYSESKITYTPDVDAKVKSTFDETENRLSLVVSGGDIADNPSNTHTYTIQFYAPSQLTIVKVNGNTLSSFAANVYDYSLEPNAYEDTKLVFYADEGTTKTTEYDEASGKLTVVIKGSDIDKFTDNYHTYTFQFSAAYSALLSSIAIDGVEINGFNANTFSYLSNSFYKDVKVTTTSVDSRATVSANYNADNQLLTIRVEAGNIDKVPTNYKEYTVQFNDPTNYSSQLKAITINGEPLEDFDRNVFDGYQVNGSFANVKVDYTADEKATVTESFDASSNILTLTVKGGNIEKDPSNYHVYKIKFSASFSYGSYVTEISLNGKTIDGFSQENYIYQIDGAYQSDNFTYTVNSLAQSCIYYDDKAKTITVVVWGGDFDSNPSNFHTYLFTFGK